MTLGMRRSTSCSVVRSLDPGMMMGGSSSLEMKNRCLSRGCLKKLGGEGGSSELGSSSMMSKRVSFHNIEISEYPMEMGDNPSAVSGVPMTIGWVPENKYTLNFDLYESQKPEPRARSEMLIPAIVRYGVLTSQGTTVQEMRDALDETRKIQMHRSKSVSNMKWDKMQFALEKAQRKMKRVVSLGTLGGRRKTEPWPKTQVRQAEVSNTNDDESPDGPITF